MDDEKSHSQSDSIDTSGDAEVEFRGTPSYHQMRIAREGPVVIMPLDASEHSMYCLTFYVKYIHKPENKIHVCYVAEDFTRRQHSAHSLVSAEVKTGDHGKKGCKSCLSCLKRVLVPRVTILDTLGPSPGMIKELEHKDRVSCKTVKTKVKDLFTSNDIKNWDFKRLTGEERWVAILKYREEMGGTMIVLGSRCLGMIKRQILGSVSEKILRKSTVPVLVVRLPYGALRVSTDALTGASVIN